MTASRKAKRAEKGTPGEPSTEGLEGLGGDDFSPDESVRQVLAGLPDDAYLEIYRFTDDGELAFCQRIRDLSSFSMADVAKHGAGRFKLMVRGGNNGRPGAAPIRRQRIVYVAASAAPAPADAQAAPGAAGGFDMATAMLAQMMQMVQQSSQMFTQQAQAQAQMHTAMMQSLVESKKPDGGVLQILTALIAREKDPMEMGLKLAEVMKGSGGGGAPGGLSEQIRAFKELRSLLDGNDDADEKMPPWLRGILAVTESPLLGKALDAATSRALPAPRIGTGRPQLRIERPNPPAPTEGAAPAMHPILAQLRYYIPMLVRAAREGSAVETYTEMMLDQVPAGHHPALLAHIERPEFGDELLAAYPVLNETPMSAAWVRSLVADLVTALRGDDEPDETDEDGGGEG